MKKEDIEKAAGDYSGSILGFRDNQSVMDKHKAFVDGAEWMINSAWHKPNEEPSSVFHLLLIEYKGGELGLGYRFDAEYVKRWAYAKDLIPNT